MAHVTYVLEIPGREPVVIPAAGCTVGRGLGNDVVLSDRSVSQAHARFIWQQQMLAVEDLGSANGTFVNGRKVHRAALRHGDAVAFARIQGRIVAQVDVKREEAEEGKDLSVGGLTGAYEAVRQPPPSGAHEQHLSFSERLQMRFDRVFLPVYRRTFAQISFPKLLVPGMVGIFLIVVLIALVPQMEETEQIIGLEAQKRAMLLAKRIIDINKTFLDQNKEHLLTVRPVFEDTSVIEALVVTPEGKILAPENRYGQLLTSPVMVRAIKVRDAYAEESGPGEIVASQPIYRYAPERGANEAYAVGVVKLSTKTIGKSGTDLLVFWLQVVLFVVAGGVLVSFLFVRLFTQPWKDLEAQTELAIQKGASQIPLVMNFVPVEQVTKAVNTLLYQCFGKKPAEAALEPLQLFTGSELVMDASGAILSRQCADADRAWLVDVLTGFESATTLTEVHDTLGTWFQSALFSIQNGTSCATVFPELKLICVAFWKEERCHLYFSRMWEA